ncbi:MAG: saccharopine dehydrogenase family protein [Thermoplasmata archaeon]
MKFLVVGAGNIGLIVASKIAESASNEVILADKDTGRKSLLSRIPNNERIDFEKIDIDRQDEARKIIRSSDILIGALPGSLGLKLIKLAISEKKSTVDVSYMDSDPFSVDADAKKSDVIIVPDCGIAPGLSNMIVGNSVKQLEEVRSVRILVGGLPLKKFPPLDYNLTWSTEGLIDEYTRPASIIQDGHIKQVDALSGLETVNMQNLGQFEAFYTDGLRTLLKTIKNPGEMWEKTLRYPGHVEKIRTIRELGYFDKEYVKIGSESIRPFDLSVKLFDKSLKRDDIHDKLIMNVEVKGVKNEESRTISWSVYDEYDDKYNMSAMSRTTAFPPAIMAEIISEKLVKERGIVPPEIIGMDDGIFRRMIGELSNEGIKIEGHS